MARKINRNMRCIEIKVSISYTRGQAVINRNMRCIEIKHRTFCNSFLHRLIET